MCSAAGDGARRLRPDPVPHLLDARPEAVELVSEPRQATEPTARAGVARGGWQLGAGDEGQSVELAKQSLEFPVEVASQIRRRIGLDLREQSPQLPLDLAGEVDARVGR